MELKRPEPNPYKPDGDVVIEGQFYGRTSLVKAILEEKHHRLLILGCRRIGKTSLIHFIYNLIKEDERYIGLWVDFGKCNDFEKLAGRFQNGISRNREIFKTLGLDCEKISDLDCLKILNKILHALQKCDKKLLLLIDEPEGLVDINVKNESAIAELKDFFELPEFCRIVVVGTNTISKLKNTLFENFKDPPIYLSNLTDDETEELIMQQKENNGHYYNKKFFEIVKDHIDDIVKLTSNHPLLIQAFCYSLYLNFSFYNIFNIEKASEETNKYLYRNRVFTDIIRHISPFQQQLIRLVVDNNEQKSKDDLFKLANLNLPKISKLKFDILIDNLVNLGMLNMEKNDCCSLSNEFLRVWVRGNDTRLEHANSNNLKSTLEDDDVF